MSCSIYTIKPASSLILVHVTKSSFGEFQYLLSCKRSGFETLHFSLLQWSFPSTSSLIMFHLGTAWAPPRGALFTAGIFPQHSCPGSHPGAPSSLEVLTHPLSRVTWRLLRWLQNCLSSWLLDQNPPSQCINTVRSPVWAEFIPMFPPENIPWPLSKTSFLCSHLYQNRNTQSLKPNTVKFTPTALRAFELTQWITLLQFKTLLTI